MRKKQFQKITGILLPLLLVAVLTFAILPKNVLPVLDFPVKQKAESPFMNDFVVYYAVARIFTQISPDKIYDGELNYQKQYEITQIPFDETTSHMRYLYPPHTALLFAPLAYLSFASAFYLWHTVLFISTILVFLLLYKAGICRTRRSFLFAAFLLSSSLPYMAAVAEGQPVMLMLLGLLAFEFMAKQKKFWLAAIVLLLTSFKPQLIIAPVLYLLIIHGWRLWRSVICFAVIVFITCSLIFSANIWLSFFQAIISVGDDARFTPLIIEKMCNFRSVLLMLFGEGNFIAINKINIMVSVVNIIASAWLSFSLRSKEQKQQELGFALVVAFSCFFSPWLHVHTLLLLVISVGYLLKYSGNKTFYGVVLGLAVLNPFVAALLTPHSVDNYLGLNSALWIIAQLLLITCIIYRLYNLNRFFAAADSNNASAADFN